MLVVAFGSFVFWAQAQEGGIPGTFERFVDWVDGRLDAVTGGDDIDEAIDYLNDRYEADGEYPRLTEQSILQIEEADLSGISLQWCSRHHVVVSAFTARGTQSSLLVAGESWGKVSADQPCPLDLSDPRPWRPPDS